MLVLRNFRRLPLFLRILSIMGLVLSVSGLGLLATVLTVDLQSWSQPPPPAGGFVLLRLIVVGENLGLLGSACLHVVNIYCLRFRQPYRGTFPLSSWQSQVRVIALLAALPLSALALALVLPPVFPAFLLALAVSVLAPGALFAATVWFWASGGVASGGLSQTPPAG
jgi:hypothetical protein